MADFPLPMSEAFLGTLDNPAISQSYRKAVIRPAPSQFTVEMYPPRKQGANFHYGMRVTPSDSPTSPVQSSARSSRSSKSGKFKEYDIFRRWEDCLDFQRTLELEYHSIAQRRRKGQPAFNHHAKNTLYPVQRAASFDSLPLGPDPSSIALDVHNYIPRLNKRTSLFRVNQATVTQRGQEFKALVEGLLDEDAHSTIQELRTIPSVRDFFALWRRDKEAERRSSKVTAAMTAPPLPDNTKAPALPQALAAKSSSPAIDHLSDFLHTPSSKQQPLKQPGTRNSYAPPRSGGGGGGRPHTANPGETVFQRPVISHHNPFSSHDELSDGTPTSSPLATSTQFASFAPGPLLRTGRSSTLPNIEYLPTTTTGAPRLGAIPDADTRAKEPLLLRTIKDNNGVVHRTPGRQVSTPELPRPNHNNNTRLDRRPSRELSSRNGNVDATRGLGPVSALTPMPPVFTLSQRYPSQPGARRATLRDEPTTDGHKTITTARSFPFDAPPDSPPVTPGMAGLGVGRTGGRHLESLAVLDPEMYQTLSTQLQQQQQQQQQAPWSLPTPTTATAASHGQVLPRARKTPPIIDTGNRSARFFVDDPTAGAGGMLVDVAGGPPPRSPITNTGAPMGMMGTEMANEEAAGQFEQVAALRQFQAMKLAKPPPGKPQQQQPVKPLLDMSDHGHNYTYSNISGNSVPGLTSPNAASSISSQGSPLSTNGQRYRSRGSLGSVAERRLSLDSLMNSDYELPYLSARNISTPQFTQKNKSADAVFAALTALNAPSVTVTPRGRSSYSSQETDSTGGFGLEDNITYSAHNVVPARLPLSKAAAIAPKTTPPPRPPRSALRNSSQFSAGIIHRLNESLVNGGSQPQNNGDLHATEEDSSHDVIESYFATPQLQHASLEPPPVLTVKALTQSPRESGMSALSNIAQYYQHTQEYHNSHIGTDSYSTAPSLPPTPFATTTTFDPASPGPTVTSFRIPPAFNGGISLANTGYVPIKAVHAQSETIVLFKISRHETTLSDLRAKIVRKFAETEDLCLAEFELKYLPPRSDHGFIAPPTGRKRSTSVTSTSDLSSLATLETEADWQRALAGNSKIVVRII